MLVAAFPTPELAEAYREELESVRVRQVVPALVALRDEMATAHRELEEATRQHDESETWHTQHTRELEDWYSSKVASLEAQIADVTQRLVAEVDRRDRVIGELRAMIADQARAKSGVTDHG